jgi:cyclopropane-fatty-acyl-phospholipid synthase
MDLAHPLPQRARESGAAASLAAFEAILGPGARGFAVRAWTGEELPPTPGERARFTVVLNHPQSLRRMFWPPSELSIGEAFVRGDFDVEGDLIAAFELRNRLTPSPRLLSQVARLLPAALTAVDGDGTARPSHAARLSGLLHRKERDSAAVRHHYDVGNDFYALWLDKRMVYSCGYFARAGATLDAAQEAKLEMLCRKMRLREGERLLDVGCGWGGLIRYAAEHHGVRALGITLSPPQAELARARVAEDGLSDRCRVEVVDYRDLQGEAFDKIVSVGMVEHVGREQLPTYFGKLAGLLRPGGVFLNHGIANLEKPISTLARLTTGRGQWLRRYVFPDSDLPAFHATAAAAFAAGLELRDVESLREHYALTLRHWLSRLERHSAAAIKEAGEDIFRIWRLYLAGSAAEFETAGIGIYQALYVKPERGASGLPLVRDDWYRTPVPGAKGPAAKPRR